MTRTTNGATCSAVFAHANADDMMIVKNRSIRLAARVRVFISPLYDGARDDRTHSIYITLNGSLGYAPTLFMIMSIRATTNSGSLAKIYVNFRLFRSK